MSRALSQNISKNMKHACVHTHLNIPRPKKNVLIRPATIVNFERNFFVFPRSSRFTCISHDFPHSVDAYLYKTGPWDCDSLRAYRPLFKPFFTCSFISYIATPNLNAAKNTTIRFIVYCADNRHFARFSVVLQAQSSSAVALIYILHEEWEGGARAIDNSKNSRAAPRRVPLTQIRGARRRPGRHARGTHTGGMGVDLRTDDGAAPEAELGAPFEHAHERSRRRRRRPEGPWLEPRTERSSRARARSPRLHCRRHRRRRRSRSRHLRPRPILSRTGRRKSVRRCPVRKSPAPNLANSGRQPAVTLLAMIERRSSSNRCWYRRSSRHRSRSTAWTRAQPTRRRTQPVHGIARRPSGLPHGQGGHYGRDRSRDGRPGRTGCRSCSGSSTGRRRGRLRRGGQAANGHRVRYGVAVEDRLLHPGLLANVRGSGCCQLGSR